MKAKVQITAVVLFFTGWVQAGGGDSHQDGPTGHGSVWQ